jgi:predicted HTH domain antitoxin
MLHLLSLTEAQKKYKFLHEDIMQTVTISVPDAILTAANMDKDEIAQTMRRECAIKLFRQRKLTLVQSAQLCGMNMYDFLTLLSQAGVPVIDYDPRELEKEIAGLH